MFDFDGTLCDPRTGIVRCLQYALGELGMPKPSEDQLSRHIGPPLYNSLATLLGSNDPELIRRAVDFYRERFAATGMFECTLYPGITHALAALRAEHDQLLLVTSKPTVFARRMIHHLGVSEFFHNIYGSELDGTRADKGELIAYVLKQEALCPVNAVMIGDRKHDIKGAIANGVHPVGVLWGYGSREELIESGATSLCATPQSLPGHVWREALTDGKTR
jgi:phosphoglycolate phosphatase